MLLGVLAVLGPAQSVRAFSDAVMFGEPAIDGGGGGRWYTGSPADGLGCDTCHEGDEGVNVAVTGLPEAGYVPGAVYDLTVRWPAWLKSASALAELTDEKRAGAGMILPPNEETVGDAERCRDEEGVLGPLGIALHQADNGRQLVSVAECGARAMHFRWMAPTAPVGTVWFAAGMVHSDNQQDVKGDHATMMLRAVPPRGGSAYMSEINAAGCSVAGPSRLGGGNGRRWAAVPAFGAILLLRRVRRGRARRSRPRERLL